MKRLYHIGIGLLITTIFGLGVILGMGGKGLYKEHFVTKAADTEPVSISTYYEQLRNAYVASYNAQQIPVFKSLYYKLYSEIKNYVRERTDNEFKAKILWDSAHTPNEEDASVTDAAMYYFGGFGNLLHASCYDDVRHGRAGLNVKGEGSNQEVLIFDPEDDRVNVSNQTVSVWNKLSSYTFECQEMYRRNLALVDTVIFTRFQNMFSNYLVGDAPYDLIRDLTDIQQIVLKKSALQAASTAAGELPIPTWAQPSGDLTKYLLGALADWQGEALGIAPSVKKTTFTELVDEELAKYQFASTDSATPVDTCSADVVLTEKAVSTTMSAEEQQAVKKKIGDTLVQRVIPNPTLNNNILLVKEDYAEKEKRRIAFERGQLMNSCLEYDSEKDRIKKGIKAEDSAGSIRANVCLRIDLVSDVMKLAPTPNYRSFSQALEKGLESVGVNIARLFNFKAFMAVGDNAESLLVSVATMAARDTDLKTISRNSFSFSWANFKFEPYSDISVEFVPARITKETDQEKRNRWDKEMISYIKNTWTATTSETIERDERVVEASLSAEAKAKREKTANDRLAESIKTYNKLRKTLLIDEALSRYETDVMEELEMFFRQFNTLNQNLSILREKNKQLAAIPCGD